MAKQSLINKSRRINNARLERAVVAFLGLTKSVSAPAYDLASLAQKNDDLLLVVVGKYWSPGDVAFVTPAVATRCAMLGFRAADVLAQLEDAELKTLTGSVPALACPMGSIEDENCLAPLCAVYWAVDCVINNTAEIAANRITEESV